MKNSNKRYESVFWTSYLVDSEVSFFFSEKREFRQKEINIIQSMRLNTENGCNFCKLSKKKEKSRAIVMTKVYNFFTSILFKAHTFGSCIIRNFKNKLFLFEVNSNVRHFLPFKPNWRFSIVVMIFILYTAIRCINNVSDNSIKIFLCFCIKFSLVQFKYDVSYTTVMSDTLSPTYDFGVI